MKTNKNKAFIVFTENHGNSENTYGLSKDIRSV